MPDTNEATRKSSFYDADEAIFCSEPASLENSIALAADNWVTSFGPLGIGKKGPSGLYPDHRLAWLQETGGYSLAGKSVLELGSLEGAHTLQYEELGCSEVIGVEANEAHFMKSLLIKNYVADSNIQFILGDFQGYLENCNRHFDLISAVGVLYHMTNPLQTIAACSKVSDAIFIWTVVYNDDLIPEGHRNLISQKVNATADDLDYEGHKHHYRSIDASRARKDKNFSGGLADYALWVEPDVLVDGLKHFGYTNVTSKLSENPRHGENILLVATK